MSVTWHGHQCRAMTLNSYPLYRVTSAVIIIMIIMQKSLTRIKINKKAKVERTIKYRGYFIIYFSLFSYLMRFS